MQYQFMDLRDMTVVTKSAQTSFMKSKGIVFDK